MADLYLLPAGDQYRNGIYPVKIASDYEPRIKQVIDIFSLSMTGNPVDPTVPKPVI